LTWNAVAENIVTYTLEDLNSLEV